MHLEHQDDDEHEASVDVGDVEGSAKTPDDGVTTNEDGQEHAGELWHQVLDQDVDGFGSFDEKTGKHDEIGKEAVCQEDEVGLLAKPDRKKNSKNSNSRSLPWPARTE